MHVGIVGELKVVFYKFFQLNIPKPKLSVYPLNLLLLCSSSACVISSLPGTWIQTFEITSNFFLLFIPNPAGHEVFFILFVKCICTIPFTTTLPGALLPLYKACYYNLLVLFPFCMHLNTIFLNDNDNSLLHR